jgi:hypothetical protein
MYIVNTIHNEFRCYGISHYDVKLYCYHTKTKELLVPTNIGQFSYISCDGNKLLYTSSTETVNCDLNGKSIWKFEDTAVLRSPRGVVVDNQGFVFVAGEKSGNSGDITRWKFIKRGISNFKSKRNVL